MRFDPRTKLIIIAVLTSLSVLSPDIIYMSVVLACSVGFGILFGVNFISIFKRIKHLLTLLFVITLLQSISVREGETLVKIGGFVILTLGGLISGVEFFLRMSIIISASSLAATSSANEHIDGLIKMKIPYEIAFMISISIKFIPLLRDEFTNRLTAISIRGIEIKGLSLVKKLKLYSFILAPTVVGCILKSREMAACVAARGFRAYKNRTMLRQLRFKIKDYVASVFALAFAAAFLTCMFTIGGIL